MMFQMIAINDSMAKISRPMPTAEDAVAFARSHWNRMQNRGVKEILIRDTVTGERKKLWSAPVPVSRLHVGYYAVDGKRYHLNRPIEGKWAGWTFLTTGSDYHDRKTIAMAAPSGSIVKDPAGKLRSIMQDPFERMVEYGKITGNCAVCGRKLENPESRKIGIGPICRQRVQS